MNKTLLRTMLLICRERWRALALFLVAGISQTLIGLLSITAFQRLLDEVVQVQQFSELTSVILWYVGLSVVNHLLIYLEGFPRSVLHNGAQMWARLRAMHHIAGIDYLAYQDLGTGQLVQLIENGAAATSSILNGFFLTILRSIIPQLIISFILIRTYDRTIFAVLLGIYVLLFVLSFYLMVSLRRARERLLDNQERFAHFSTRGFMELVVFRIGGRFGRELARVRRIAETIVGTRARIYGVQELFFTGFALLVFGLQAGVVIWQARQIVAGLSTLGTLVALVALIAQATSPISHLGVAYVDFRLEEVAYRRFADFLALPQDRGLGHGAEIDIGKGEIVFDQVSFSYQDLAVLSGLSLTFEGGKVSALVGTSGSGKSTIVRLLLHLLKPDAGRVLVDGHDLSTVNLASLYRQVAYIPQEPPIFDGTMLENLSFDEQVDHERLEEVIRQVGLDDLVARLPEGLNTVVGERGLKLSGGERQRLAFGRVMIHDPRIVILDEPTAALDSLTERFVTDHARAFWSGKTVIVIAHRLQTIKDVDQILVIESGEIVEQGRFGALLAGKGVFFRLWEEQTKQTVKPPPAL